MDNNESNNPKPQETGGLKLMTVFIGVLALHVVVIGGFTVYHLMSGGSTDPDLVADKNHKGVKVTPDSATVSDSPLPDTTGTDKSSIASMAPATTTGNPVTIPAPAADTPAAATASSDAPAPIVPTSTQAPAPTLTPAHEPTANAPSGPIQSGPVITPSNPAPEVAAESATPAPGQAETDSTDGTTYTVKSHDTLARIAHHNHVKIATLRSANALRSDHLHLGQKLIIPTKTELASSPDAPETESTHSSGPDRTLLGDSPMFSKSVSSTRHDKSMMASGGGGRHTYTVAKGDTLIRIAHKFHTSSNAIMALNNISDARKLRLGQKLKIPSSESRSATSAPAPAPQDRIEPRATPAAQLANFIN